MIRTHRKKTILVSVFLLLSAAIGLFCYSSAFASIRRLTRGAYFVASNGKEALGFTGNVKATPKGKPALTLSIKSLMKENQLYLFVGRVAIKGQFTPQSASALPAKLRFAVNHKNASNKIVGATNFDVNVQSNGAILMQTFSFANFDLIDPKESVELSVLPMDQNMPAGSIAFTATHTLGASLAEDNWSAESEAAAPPKFSFTFNNFLSGHPKNQIIGPLLLKVPTQPNYFAQGTLHVQGKITPDDPGGLPNRFQIILKHKLQQVGKLLKTEMFPVVVGSDGKILLQNFPVNGKTDVGTPDQMEVSMKYLDKNIPDRETNVTFSFSPSPSTN